MPPKHDRPQSVSESPSSSKRQAIETIIISDDEEEESEEPKTMAPTTNTSPPPPAVTVENPTNPDNEDDEDDGYYSEFEEPCDDDKDYVYHIYESVDGAPHVSFGRKRIMDYGGVWETRAEANRFAKDHFDSKFCTFGQEWEKYEYVADKNGLVHTYATWEYDDMEC